MQKVRGSNPLSSTGFSYACSRKSDNPLSLDHGLTWANAELRTDALHAEGRGSESLSDLSAVSLLLCGLSLPGWAGRRSEPPRGR